MGGLEFVAELLAGVEIDWVTTVRRCYGIEVGPTPEEEFERVHAQLDAVLPGTGDLAGRLEAWSESQTIPPEKLLDAYTALQKALREATRSLVELPAGEEIDVELVSHEPWSAYNWYLGGRRSKYPGEHRPAAPLAFAPAHRRPRGLSRPPHGARVQGGAARGRARPARGVDRPHPHAGERRLGGNRPDRRSTRLSGRPGPPAQPRSSTRSCIPFDAEIAAAVHDAEIATNDVAVNISYFASELGWSREELVAYQQRWALATEERAEKRVDFATHPFWGAYTPTYAAGHRLAASFSARAPENFRRLLTEELTPADLSGP